MKTSLRIPRWTARILCMAAILFVSVFALDSFSPELSLTDQLTGFAIHLIPTYILTAALILAWKRELTGGIVFILIALGWSPFIYTMNYGMNHSVLTSLQVVFLIAVPFVAIGILFILSHSLRKRRFNDFISSNPSPEHH